jgi:hypothetical protein
MASRDEHVAAVEAAMAALAEWTDMVLVAHTKGQAVADLVADSTDPFRAGAITAWHSCEQGLEALSSAEQALAKANEYLINYREAL